jgi:hypothetical protein
MRWFALSIMAVVLTGCGDTPNTANVPFWMPSFVGVPTTQASARPAHSSGAQSADAPYDPAIIGRDIPETSQYSNREASAQVSAPSTQPAHVANSATIATPMRRPVTARVNASATTQPAIAQAVAGQVLAGQATSGQVTVDGAGAPQRASADSTPVKALPAQALFDPSYPKPSFVQPEESKKTPEPAAPAQSATVYPTRGQAAEATGSATLYPPTGRFNTEPGNPSLYPRGPLAPSGFRGQ